MEGLLYQLEDDEMLHGQISIVGLEHLDLTDKFIALFDCDWDKVDCALMTVGDYKQQEMRAWRYQVGSSTQLIAWDELFHKSRNKGFENTGKILIDFLEGLDEVSDETLDKVITKYIDDCESKNRFPWRYYYVKYPAFRPGRYGKLAAYGESGSEYMFAVLQTRSNWSENSYLPYLKAADGKHIDRDDFGRSLDYGDCYIQCSGDSYIVRNNADEMIDTLMIQQTDGVDTEDRVIKLREYINNSLNQ